MSIHLFLLLYLVVKAAPCPHSFHCHWSYVWICVPVLTEAFRPFMLLYNYLFLSVSSPSCSTSHRPHFLLSNITRDPSFNREHTTFVVHPYGNKKTTSTVSRYNGLWKLMTRSFTWGVLSGFWVLVRRGVAGLGVSARVEDFDAVNAWHPFLSILPAYPCRVWGLGGRWKTRTVELSLGFIYLHGIKLKHFLLPSFQSQVRQETFDISTQH